VVAIPYIKKEAQNYFIKFLGIAKLMPQLENIYYHSRLAVATQLVKTWICTILVDLMVHADWALPSK